MLTIDSDDPAITECLRALEAKVVEAGGAFSPKMRVVAADGNLWIESDPPDRPREELMMVPKACMPTVDAYQYAAADGKAIVVEEVTGEQTELQQSFMSLMLDLYNMSGKLEAMRGSHPFFLLAPFPEVRRKFYEGHSREGIVLKSYEKQFEKAPDEFGVERFFEMRVFGFSGPGKPNERVLMPYIDFLNHSNQSTGYQNRRTDTGEEALWAINRHDTSGSREVSVVYHPNMDAFDSLIQYGFLDTSGSFVLSVPVTARFQGGEKCLEVMGHKSLRPRTMPEYKISDPVRAVKHLLPPVNFLPDGTGGVHALVIPGKETPRALRRVLKLIVERYGLSERDTDKAVLEIERQIIAENFKYYTELEDVTAKTRETAAREDSAGLDSVDALIAHQMACLENYALAFSLDRPERKAEPV